MEGKDFIIHFRELFPFRDRLIFILKKLSHAGNVFQRIFNRLFHRHLFSRFIFSGEDFFTQRGAHRRGFTIEARARMPAGERR